MSDFSHLTNHQFRLASRPVGLPTHANWSRTQEPVQAPPPGGLLLKTLALSLDPAMRGWMNEGKSYIAPVAIGEVMRAGGVGVVVASKNPAFAVGDPVSATLGVQEYCLIPAAQIQRSALVRIEPEGATDPASTPTIVCVARTAGRVRVPQALIAQANLRTTDVRVRVWSYRDGTTMAEGGKTYRVSGAASSSLVLQGRR